MTRNHVGPIPDDITYGFVSAVVGDFLYVMGGRRNKDKKKDKRVHKYDFAAKTWLPCAPIPQNDGSGTQSGEAWGDKIYVLGGGEDEPLGPAILQIYDTAQDSWSRGPDLGAPHETAVSVAVDGKVYFFGGFEDAWEPGKLVDRETVNIYDTATDTWSTGPPLQPARADSAIAWVGDRFHLIGGYVGPGGTAIALHEVLYP